VALRAIADESESVVLEVVLELGQRPVGALVDLLLRARKVERLNSTSLQYMALVCVGKLHHSAHT
jgi:hypothetical protein